nr:PR domain zinc finger protein 10-like [Dermatophagoides farinae]
MVTMFHDDLSYVNDTDVISLNSMTNSLLQPPPQHTKSTLQYQENVIQDLPVLTRARATLPIEYLYLHEMESETINNNDGSGSSIIITGVFARKQIPKRTQFGPIEGVMVELSDETSQYQPNIIAYSSKSNLIIFLSNQMILSQSDENGSNWTRFIRPAQTLAEQNIELVAKEFSTNEFKLFLLSTRTIMPDEELKAWYSPEYAETFGIKLLAEIVDIKNDVDDDNNNNNVHMIDKTSTSDSNNNGIHYQQQQQQQTGHKLRNKIAKTQQIMVNNNNNSSSSSSSNNNNK